MFHNLLRVFHDGIMLIEQDKIVYTNKQILNLFNIIPQEFNRGEDDLESGPPRSVKERLIDAISIARPKLDTISAGSEVTHLEKIGFDFNNLWDYI